MIESSRPTIPEWKKCPEARAIQLIDDVRNLIYRVIHQGNDRDFCIINMARTILEVILYDCTSWGCREEIFDNLVSQLKEDMQVTAEYMDDYYAS